MAPSPRRRRMRYLPPRMVPTSASPAVGVEGSPPAASVGGTRSRSCPRRGGSSAAGAAPYVGGRRSQESSEVAPRGSLPALREPNRTFEALDTDEEDWIGVSAELLAPAYSTHDRLEDALRPATRRTFVADPHAVHLDLIFRGHPARGDHEHHFA